LKCPRKGTHRVGRVHQKIVIRKALLSFSVYADNAL
jgi:hypothetical protein